MRNEKTQQLVWKSSTTLGMGSASVEKNGMYCTYVVARYKVGNKTYTFMIRLLPYPE